MRTSLKFLLGLSSAVLASSAALAANPILIPIIPFPDATTTYAFGIADDNNTITGSYVDSGGVTHGFYGTLDGNYTSFDFPGADSTQARAISGDGTLITGFSDITLSHCSFPEWEFTVGGAIKQIKKGGTALFGAAQGINRKGVFAGDYCDSGGIIHGQLGQNYKFKRNVTTPFDSPYTGERAVNKNNTVVGFYVDSGTGLQIGTVITGGGVTSTVTYPDASESYTVMEGINNDGAASGQWGDTGGIVHAFAYDTNASTFVEIDDPNAASFTQAWGVNKAGLIAVTSDAGAYIYCPLRRNKCPSTGTAAIELHVKPIHVAPGKLLSYGDTHAGNRHAPVKQVLPHGAALQ